ncbi:MAG: Mut7-C RNAse domain-containing protein [Bacteroidia bacterium]
MITILLAFFDELPFFLPKNYREGDFYNYTCAPNESVKDCIEAQGIPHTEVEWILANGNSVNFAYQVKEHDKIEIYPYSSQLDLPVIVRPNLSKIAFITDANVGKLTKNLRLMGFHVRTDEGVPDKEIAAISERENLIVLSRDIGLLKRKNVTFGRYLHSEKIEEQLIEVMKRFDLPDKIRPFTLCLVCDGKIQQIEKETVQARVTHTIYQEHKDFYQCENCQKVYWEGSHFDKMKENIAKVRAELRRK